MHIELEQTRDEVVLSYTKIVDAHVKYYRRYYKDVQSLRQEGYLGVMYALANWIPELGKSLDQFIRQSVDWKMKNAIRAHKKLLIVPNELLDSADVDERFEQIENKEYARSLIRFVSDRQAQVLRHLYVDGDCTNFQEVADKMNITREGVRQLYNKGMATITQSVWGL